jgi:hypothetical protein
MAQVWARLDCSGGELLLALALADIADDDGDRIYPSVETLAYKTRQSGRQVQRQLKRFRERGWLQVKKLTKGGRRSTNRYRISPGWINGDILSGFPDQKPRHLEQETVTSETRNGDIAMSPNPSLSIIEPKKRARKNPDGSRASELDKKRKKIRERIHDLRLVPYGRNPKVIADGIGCSVEEVQRELDDMPAVQ